MTPVTPPVPTPMCPERAPSVPQACHERAHNAPSYFAQGASNLRWISYHIECIELSTVWQRRQ